MVYCDSTCILFPYKRMTKLENRANRQNPNFVGKIRGYLMQLHIFSLRVVVAARAFAHAVQW
jgi:hypothetical protein